MLSVTLLAPHYRIEILQAGERDDDDASLHLAISREAFVTRQLTSLQNPPVTFTSAHSFSPTIVKT